MRQRQSKHFSFLPLSVSQTLACRPGRIADRWRDPVESFPLLEAT